MTTVKNNSWQTLSAIDVSKHIDKKGNLSYLSWAWAWGTLMDNYPDSTYEIEPPVQHPDGSVTVWVALTVDGMTRKMWLPVMDNRNNAIQNPDARKISDATMRCLVKCIALFGLGHYIYAGEDLPEAVKEEQAKAEANRDIPAEIAACANKDELWQLWSRLSPEQHKQHAEAKDLRKAELAELAELAKLAKAGVEE